MEAFEKREAPIAISDPNKQTRSQAIKAFLEANTHRDLADLYSLGMECQVIVAKGDGRAVEMEFRGRQYKVYQNASGETWKSFRIPYNAASEPEYDDVPMAYDLGRHAEGIGMTGWNWMQRKSIFVAFDFDAVVGHAQGISNADLEAVKAKALELPWVTVRKSTSGSGLHLYVFLEPVETANHNEHAALARSILAKMASLTGFDFQSKVDICGGNMWCWHRKMVADDGSMKGLAVVKEGCLLADIPSNWRSHVHVTKRLSRKSQLHLPVDNPDKLDDVLNERALIPLDEEHIRLVQELEGTDSWWDADRHLLVTHTHTLYLAHKKLALRGVYETISTGKESGFDHNCFAIPRPNGAWLLRRYNKVEEVPPWIEDDWGYISCYYNRDPDLRSLAISMGGIETEKRGLLFTSTEKPTQILEMLGYSLGLTTQVHRQTTIKQDNEGKIIVKVDKADIDTMDVFKGFEPNKDGTWTKIIRLPRKQSDETEVLVQDRVVRHLVSDTGKEMGWMLATETGFIEEPLQHIKLALTSLSYSTKEISNLLGASVMSPWKQVCRPFEEEYPGNRQWNINSPQLIYNVKEDGEHLNYSAWMEMLNHLGQSLDPYVQADEWCQASGIETGGDYLKCWCASMLQEPTRPLPYLFFVGPQNCGKSLFHESLSTLFKPGYILADSALKSQGDFNGELINKVLCVVEEVDLSDNRSAYNKIKEWVTSPYLLLHVKTETPYLIANTTHWVQCSNDFRACPVLPGDTRVVMIQVKPLAHIIPRRAMDELLRAQAQDFTTELLRMELPVSPDRLNLPPIRSDAKTSLELSNMNEVQTFIHENCYQSPGSFLGIDELHEAFLSTLTAGQAVKWGKARFNRMVPLDNTIFIKGRHPSGKHIWGNMALEPYDSDAGKEVIWRLKPGAQNDYLHLVEATKEDLVNVTVDK